MLKTNGGQALVSQSLNSPGREQAPDVERHVSHLREYVPIKLRESLERAVARYQRFDALCDAEDPKSFSAHQSGCRAALAHIHLLIKLIEWSCSDKCFEPHEKVNSELDQLLSEARFALSEEPNQKNEE